MEMRKERFSDASGFVFTFVGNIQIDSIRPYIEQYLATLPSQGKIEKGNPAEVPSTRKGDYMNRFNRSMEIPKVTVANLYTGQMEYNLENIITATALKQVMDLVYYEKVRERREERMASVYPLESHLSRKEERHYRYSSIRTRPSGSR